MFWAFLHAELKMPVTRIRLPAMVQLARVTPIRSDISHRCLRVLLLTLYTNGQVTLPARVGWSAREELREYEGGNGTSDRALRKMFWWSVK